MGVGDHRRTIRAARWFAASAAAILLSATSTTQAQQPKAAPKAAQPAAPAQKPAGDELPPLVYSTWTKVCGKENQAGAKEVCLTVKEARLESGQFVASVALIEPTGEPKKILRITVPLGMQLAVGTRVLVDKGQASVGQYIACFPNGCMADFEVNSSFIGLLKTGKTLWLQAINIGGQPASYPLPLEEFVKVNEGPPTDPKVFEAQQQKMQEEIERRSAQPKR